MRKIRVHLYPNALAHRHDTVEWPEYVNTVPLSKKGLEEHAKLVPPDRAEFFYMGQFHYEDTLRDGFRLERFPYLEKYPERHIADIEGDWDLRKLPPIFWRCLLTVVNHHHTLCPKDRVFVRCLNSRLLMSLLHRQDSYPFEPSRAVLGFRGNLSHSWVRLLLLAHFTKWEFPAAFSNHMFGFGSTDPGCPAVKEYENFLLQHGLSLCPRGAARGMGDVSIRFYESCFYSCVPIIIGEHGVVGEDYYNTSFLYRISHEASEREMKDFFTKILATPFPQLKERAEAARRYFDEVVRYYFQDPTELFLNWLVRHRVWKG